MAYLSALTGWPGKRITPDMVLPARRVTHAVDILSTFADFSVEA